MTTGQLREKMLSNEQKEQKRKSIAKSTCALFIKKGYVNITISEIAKVANIGKGTVYEYFKNKEEIVFELMACLQEDYDPKLQQKLQQKSSTKQKTLHLFDLYLSSDEIIQTQRKIYKEYLSVFIGHKTEKMKEYHYVMIQKYTTIVKNIFTDAIQNGELSELALEMIPSIFATLDGFFIAQVENDVIYKYVDTLFVLLENKKTDINQINKEGNL